MLHKKNCPYCKKDFVHIDNRRKFCSSLCANRFNKMFGEDNPKAKMRKWHKGNGYILMNKDGKRIFQHREIMEKHIGRKLKKDEVVHHINNIRDDNALENLMLFPNNRAHRKWHEFNNIGVNQYSKK